MDGWGLRKEMLTVIANVSRKLAHESFTELANLVATENMSWKENTRERVAYSLFPLGSNYGMMLSLML